MNKTLRKSTRLKLASVVATVLAIIGIVNMLPFNVNNADETGGSFTTYGIPFTFYSVESPSYPNAVSIVEFHIGALVANILIGAAVISLSVYLFRIMKSRLLHNKS